MNTISFPSRFMPISPESPPHEHHLEKQGRTKAYGYDNGDRQQRLFPTVRSMQLVYTCSTYRTGAQFSYCGARLGSTLTRLDELLFRNSLMLTSKFWFYINNVNELNCVHLHFFYVSWDQRANPRKLDGFISLIAHCS